MVCLLCVAAPASAENVLAVLSSDAEPYQQAVASLRKRLQEREQRLAAVLLSDLVEDYDKYVTDETDAVVGVGTRAAVWLHRNAGESVLVSYCMVASPEDVGLTKGRPAYGVSTQIPLAEQFRFMARVMPGARTVGMLYNAESKKSKTLYERVKKSLPRSWRLQAVAKKKDTSVADAIDQLFEKSVDVVWTAPDASIYDIPTVRTLLLAAMRHKKPVFGFSPQFVRAGALFGIGVNPAKQGEQVADIVRKELSRLSTAPATDDDEEQEKTHPPEPPEFETAVNLIVAEKLEMSLPRTIIREAEHVWPEKKNGEDEE
jgi:putative ABC transport system substrate-binding protein